MKEQLSIHEAFTAIDARDMAVLTTQVQEVIAFELVAPATKIFTTADLWNINRQAKVRAQRRFL